MREWITFFVATTAWTFFAADMTHAAPPTSQPMNQQPFASDCGQWYGLFNLPVAQYRGGRTFVIYPDRMQRPVADCYDHASRKWLGPVLVSKQTIYPDDHGNPAMLMDADGFLHVFFGCHGGPMHYAKSAKPNDISTWTEMPPIAPRATYPQAMLMPDGEIDLFYRAGGHTDDWVLQRSRDNGKTWSAAQAIIDGSPPREAWYVCFAKGSEGTVHVGFCWKDDTNGLGAPGAEFTHRYNLYYMHRDAHGIWTSASGEKLSLPVAREQADRLCKAYDSRAKNELTGGCSIAVIADDKPRILFRTAAPFGTTTYRHRLAAWDGHAWTISDVGPEVDAKFTTFVRDDNFLLQQLPSGQLRALLVDTINESPVRTEMTQWRSDDDTGRTWKKERIIYADMSHAAQYFLIGPKLVLDAQPDAWLVFGLEQRFLFGDSGYIGR